MDWFTILLLLIFFVFPLIQHLLEGRQRKSQVPPEMDLDPREEERAVPEGGAEERRRPEPIAAPPEPRGRRGERVEEGWSAGWGGWPGQGGEVEVPPMERPKPGMRGAGRTTGESVAKQLPRAEPVPRAVRVPRPQKAEGRPPRPREESRPRGAREGRGKPPPRPVPAFRLGSQEELRRAIVLNEILGTPVALRGRREEPAPGS